MSTIKKHIQERCGKFCYIYRQGVVELHINMWEEAKTIFSILDDVLSYNDVDMFTGHYVTYDFEAILHKEDVSEVEFSLLSNVTWTIMRRRHILLSINPYPVLLHAIYLIRMKLEKTKNSWKLWPNLKKGVIVELPMLPEKSRRVDIRICVNITSDCESQMKHNAEEI